MYCRGDSFFEIAAVVVVQPKKWTVFRRQETNAIFGGRRAKQFDRLGDNGLLL